MTAFSYTNPTVGGSEDTWGETLNANWTALGNFIGPLDSTELAVLDGITATTAELNYVDGVTSAIQPQLDAKSTSSKTETLINKTITAPVINSPVINGAVSGDSLSTQAEAQAGTSDNQLMTPLRTAQAIAALTPPSGGTTLIATIPMVGYGSLSATGLDLSSYKSLEIVFYSFYPSAGGALRINNNTISGNVGTSTTTVFSKLYLDTSICVTSQKQSPSLGGYPTLVTNATTSLTFSAASSYYYGQTIYVYGVA